MRVAVLIDGGFFLRRIQKAGGNWVKLPTKGNPDEYADAVYSYAFTHTSQDNLDLYRIFYYDCPPLSKKAHNPISGKAVDFSKTDTAKFRLEFFENLKKKRKLALRLGYLDEDRKTWSVYPEKLKELLNGKITVSDLTEDDVYFDTRQKGVDSKVAVDVASLAFKKQVDRIVLIAGDADFVPAAKLARREGIDFVLDPMHNPIKPDLYEHIDGLGHVREKRPSRVREKRPRKRAKS